MKKHFIITIILLFLSANLFSQAGIDPSHNFYTNVERWEIMGLIEEQPPLKPYSLNLIEDILEQVIECDNENESQLAQELYSDIFDKKLKIKLQTDANLKFSQNNNSKQIIVLPGADGDFNLMDLVSVSYKIDESITNNTSLDSLPVFSAQNYFFRDPAKIKNLKACLAMDAGIAVGTKNIYAQMGINNSSFGPMYKDNAVISPDAKHTANFNFVYINDLFTYTQSIIGLTASNAINDYLYPQKYLALHSVNANLFDWLSASFYEVVLFGNRFEPAYIIPAPYMVTQGLAGFDDNLFMGLSFSIRPINDLVWISDFYIDDLGVNELVKLNFDTKIRGTFQTAIKYIPSELSWFDFIKLDYSLVTPYMYTHNQNINNIETGISTLGTKGAVNYQQYTSAGYALGLNLPPNSDRVSISASFTPVKNLKIDLNCSYTRHANVNESISTDEAISYLNSPEDYLATDGTINNHQHYLRDGDPTNGRYLGSAWNHFLFMTQPTKMQIFRTDLDAEYAITKTKFGTFSFTAGYTFEYIKNYGVDRDIFKGYGIYDENGNWKTANKTADDVQAALTEWKKGIKDITSHYLRIGFKYVW
ncbi:MAG: hypothetical protein J5726_05120 [Treponema sp.]|nr:hypothetical protein [Treponema sp.]